VGQDQSPIQDQLETETETEGIIDLVGGIIKAYEYGFNINNPKNEIKFSLTITNHKVATPDGNKHCAYLRLDRSIRPKTEEGKEESEWSTKLLHNEAYFFKSMQERVNKLAPWKEQLYTNLLARLVGAGLEYAELLQRIKQVEHNQKSMPKTEEEATEQKLNDLGLVGAKQQPAPLTPQDEKYKEWLAEQRAKEGL